MNVRAAIFDVYGTILEVNLPPEDPAVLWERLWQTAFAGPPAMSQTQFSEACRQVVAREHEAARARGILHPEVVWSAVVAEVLPRVNELSQAAREEVIHQHAQTSHRTALLAESASVLGELRAAGCHLGIASNAQAYTLRELSEALRPAGIRWEEWFDPELCFWSYKHGFSKPDPHVYQLLTARLRVRGILPNEIVMVGDRLDNDVEPARACGWKAWWLTPNPGAVRGGDWRALRAALWSRE